MKAQCAEKGLITEERDRVDLISVASATKPPRSNPLANRRLKLQSERRLGAIASISCAPTFLPR